MGGRGLECLVCWGGGGEGVNRDMGFHGSVRRREKLGKIVEMGKKSNWEIEGVEVFAVQSSSMEEFICGSSHRARRGREFGGRSQSEKLKLKLKLKLKTRGEG